MAERDAMTSLWGCLEVFRALGDDSGAEACLRGLAALAARPFDVDTGSAALTARERQVAMLIATGASNRAIARALGIREGTATRHVANLLSKLGFHSRAQVAQWATINRL
jgi:DNA-binding NarL/FixJ family response regulator